MSNKAAALEVQKCFVCEAPTTNKPHLGQILCDDCTAELDNEIDRQIDEALMQEHYNDLNY